jgi:hypothetical protein
MIDATSLGIAGTPGAAHASASCFCGFRRLITMEQ